MTNGEKYKTAQERAVAFEKYCKKMHNKPGGSCVKRERCSICALYWIDLECEDEERHDTIDDVIADMKNLVKMTRKKESEGGTLLDVSVILYKLLNRIIAAHNRVAKAVKESEVKV